MRRLFVLLAVMGIFSACQSEHVEVGNKTTFEVDDVFEAGDVVKGEKIRAKFTVTNTGDYPLVIPRVQPSCSCTVGEIPSGPIQPGKSGTITATIDTDKLELGPLTKTLTMIANTDPSNKTLVIKANVMRK